MGGINGNSFGLNFQATVSLAGARKGQGGGLPAYDNNKVYNSLGEINSALQGLRQKWNAHYSESFSKMENGGKVTVGQLKEEIMKEFGSYGIQLTDTKPGDIAIGKHLVYIDEANLQKMADDPTYRADNFALMRREFSTKGGITYKDYQGRTVKSSSAGSVFSLSEDNPLVDGSRYNGSSQGQKQVIAEAPATTARNHTKSKSAVDQAREKQIESREKREARRKKERAEEERRLEKREAAERVRAQTAERADGARDIAPVEGAAEIDGQRPAGPSSQGGGLDLKA